MGTAAIPVVLLFLLLFFSWRTVYSANRDLVRAKAWGELARRSLPFAVLVLMALSLFVVRGYRESYVILVWMLIFGILILNFGPADGPTQILDILAFLSAFVMGAYCLVLVAVNNKNLPKKIRPHFLISAVLIFGGLGYLTAIFYSVIKFGVSDIG